MRPVSEDAYETCFFTPPQCPTGGTVYLRPDHTEPTDTGETR
jgi:hypothetical protein